MRFFLFDLFSFVPLSMNSSGAYSARLTKRGSGRSASPSDLPHRGGACDFDFEEPNKNDDFCEETFVVAARALLLLRV